MKKKELLYRAVGNLDDGTVNDAMEHEVECRDHSRLFAVLEGVAIVAVVCGLIAFSFVLMKFAGEKTDPAASGEISAAKDQTGETTDFEIIAADSKGEESDTTENENNYELIMQMLNTIYTREDTTQTQFLLLQDFDTEKYQIFDPGIIRPAFYFDDRWEKYPVYYNGGDEPVWYKPPYVRYQVMGYPDRFEDKTCVTHIDICGIDFVSICGITVNSTFDEFRETFSNLGFSVTGGDNPVSLPYSTQRNVIAAEYNGLWIVLEQASEADTNLGAYGEAGNYLNYENNVVPAILRIGVAVKNYSHVEQYELP